LKKTDSTFKRVSRQALTAPRKRVNRTHRKTRATAKAKRQTYRDLSELLDAENLGLVLKLSDESYEWCVDFIAVLVWFASMFEEDFVFRGHADKTWNLQPKICRISLESPPKTFDELIKTERRFVDEVRRAQWLTLRDGFSPSEYLDFIGVLQHKGVPTRLIDVTADPLVATYFASLNEKCDGAVIALLRREHRLNDTAGVGLDPVRFKEDGVYTIWSPPPIDLRMIAQRGEFLLANGAHSIDLSAPIMMADLRPRGKAMYKLERIAKEYFQFWTRGRPVEHPPNLAMFHLPSQYKVQMRNVLKSLGLTSRSLFPDLQGYAAIFGI